MNPVLDLENATIEYDHERAISNLSLSVERGETLVLMGGSGSGKTSVIRALLGLLVPSRGVVRIAGAIASRDGKLHRTPESRGLAAVFQDLALWPHMTVHGNLAFVLEARRSPRVERERRIGDLLERLGLANRADRYPRDLSGGERQRVALARALVVEPKAILLDEPLASLDVLLKRDLTSLLRELFHERGNTALYVTHDPSEARAIGDRIAVLHEGRIVQSGSWSELCATPANAFVRALTEAGGTPREKPASS